ncbi:MAG: nuclease [Devosia sp.]|nr:nuclease [Devosia sp.]
MMHALWLTIAVSLTALSPPTYAAPPIGTLITCATLSAVDGDTIKCNGISMRDMGDGAPFVSGVRHA